MPYAVGRLYVSKYFDSNSKKIAESMINKIIVELSTSIKKVNWMDNKSKQLALEKVTKINVYTILRNKMKENILIKRPLIWTLR